MSSRYIIPSVDRAIDVLDILASSHRPMGLAEIQRETGIPKSTLFRILTTMQARRLVECEDDGKRFKLGVKLWEFGNAFLRDVDLYSISFAHLKQLAHDTGESVFLGVLDESEVIYIQRMESPKSVTVVRKLEQRAPAHCTATGEAILAFLPTNDLHWILENHELRAFNPKTVTDRDELERRLKTVRDEGVAVVDGEYNAEVLCISSPIFDSAHHPCASVTVAMLSAQVADNSERIEEVRSMVKTTANRISTELGFLVSGKPDEAIVQA